MACGFLAGTPYALMEPALFWRDMTGEATHLRAGHSVFLGIGWLYHARVTLRYGVTTPLLAAGLIGAVLLAVRRARDAALLLAFPVAYYIVAGRGYTVFARYMVPMVPFVCVCAGYFTTSIARAIAARAGARAFAPAAVVIAVVLGMPSLSKAVQMDRVLARKDSRAVAGEWLREHVPAGASMVVTGSRFGFPGLWRRGMPPPWAIWTYDEDRHRFVTASGPSTAWPAWIVVQQSPLLAYSSVPPDIQSELWRYDLRQSVVALSMSAPHVFDQQDAFYLPLDGFEGVARPGPNLYVYRLRP